MKSYASRISSAVLAQGSSAVLSKLSTLVATVLLARMLLAEDFGLQTIAFIVLSLASTFSNFGFQVYIIQAKELPLEKSDACFTLNVIFSAALGFCLVIAGYVLSTNHLLLSKMLYLYGAFVFLSGLTYSKLALLKRNLHFKESAKSEVAYSLVSNGGRLVFASIGLGALCFPMGDLLGAIARLLVTNRNVKSQQRMRLPSKTVLKEIMGFGVHTSSIGIASFVANQVDKILLAASQSITQVGIYGFATSMASMFYNAAIVPQAAVFMSAYSRLQDNVSAVRQMLSNSSRIILSIALPLNVLWLLEAESIVTLVFGVKWLDAAPIIRILAVDYIVRSMFSSINGLQLAFGYAANAAWTKWLNTSIFVALMTVAWASEFDLNGYALMFVASNILATCHNVHVNGKIIGFQFWPFMSNLATPIGIAIASTACWLMMSLFFPIDGPVWNFILRGGMWMLAYMTLSLAFNRVVINHFITALNGGKKI